MVGADRRYRDSEWLREQYHGLDKSTYEIAELCGCAPTTIQKWLRKNDIRVKDLAEAKGTGRDNPVRDESWLREKYLEEGLSITEISDICDRHYATVLSWIERHGIRVKDPSESRGVPKESPVRNPGWLREKYVDEGLTFRQISDILNIGRKAVRGWAKKHGLDIRNDHLSQENPLRDAEWVRGKYVDEKMSSHRLSEITGHDHKTVLRWLYEHGIDVRDRGDYTGPDSHRWKGGEFPYGEGWNEQKREKVRDRDGNECVRCGVGARECREKYGRKLSVHHIISARDITDPERRNSPENLITVCPPCHRKYEKITNSGMELDLVVGG